MSAWPTVPGIALMVICLTAGGLIRDLATDVYYGKPKPANLDIFTKALAGDKFTFCVNSMGLE